MDNKTFIVVLEGSNGFDGRIVKTVGASDDQQATKIANDLIVENGRSHDHEVVRAYEGFEPATAAGIAEGWILPESEEQYMLAWQWLHDTGLAYRLQGWYGRTARALLMSEQISE